MGRQVEVSYVMGHMCQAFEKRMGSEKHGA